MNYIIFILSIVLIILIIYVIIKTTNNNSKSIHEILYPHYYSSKFHESVFISNDDKYNKYVKSGYEVMKTKKISYIGLAYNLGTKVHKILKRCQRLKEPWLDAHFVIYCFDSTDDTYNILNKDKPDWLTLPIDILENKNKMTRFERMAHLRNICLKYIRPNDDYVMVIDWDLAGPISLDGIANSVTYIDNNEYDVLCSNGLVNNTGLPLMGTNLGYIYYDPLAVKKLNGHRPTTDRDDMRRGEEPIKVISGFGGAAIYKSKLFTIDKFKYNPDINDCEHVVMHEDMYNNNNTIGINPSLILLSGLQGGS